MKKSPFLAFGSVSLFALMSSSAAFAAPFQYPKCNVPSLKTPAQGAGVYLDEECKTAYVLPPVVGKSELVALAQNTNLNFCPAVLKTSEVTSSTIESAGVIASKIKDMITDFDPLKKEIVDMRLEAATLSAVRDAAKSKADNATTRKGELIAEIAKANTALSDCKIVAADPIKDCENETAAVAAVKEALRSHIIKVASPADDALVEANLAYSKLQNKIVERNKFFVDSITPMLDLQSKLADLESKVFDLYKQYTPLEGATGQIVYSVQWDKLVQDFEDANKDAGLNWTRIPVKDASFNASVRLGKGNDSSLPAVLWSRIPGAEAIGPATPPAGDAVIGASPTVPSGRDIADVSIGFGNSVSGQLALSLAGACAYFPDGVNTSKSAIDFQDFNAHLVGNVNYTYELAARRGYTARYNLSNFVSRIESNVKKGGWFSTKNINTVIEDNKSSDWFEIKFDADSGEFQYTAQEQSDLTKDVKASLIDRAMRNLGSINGLNSTPPALPPEPGPSGVGVAAASLRRGCWYNYWCQAGSYVLGTLDSIFGSKSSVSNFQKSNNVWVTDSVRGISIIDRSSAFTFQPIESIK